MKLNAKPLKTAPPVNGPEPSSGPDVPKGYRRLKWNEVVSVGDFVADEREGLKLWEGPGGFRADSFEKPIYRQESRAPSAKKSK